MSNKLIAVAAAAALALTGLVAAPANATVISGVVIDGGTSRTTSSTTVIRPASAMTSRTLDYFSTSSTTRNVVRFEVTTTAASTVAVTSRGGVKVLTDLTDSAGAALNVGAGSESIGGSTITNTYTFFAYSTSSTAGTVTINTPNSTLTYAVAGVAGAPYNIVGATFPTTVTQGETEALSTAKVTFKLTDVFGNEISTVSSTVLRALGASASTVTYSSVRKVWEGVVFNATGSNVSMSLELTATDLSTNGFAKPVIAAFSTVSAADLAGQVTTLTAQVAALAASLAALQIIKDEKVSKLKYNRLARKWNAAFPNNKVWVKP
jgi:hypothetical protein